MTFIVTSRFKMLRRIVADCCMKFISFFQLYCKHLHSLRLCTNPMLTSEEYSEYLRIKSTGRNYRFLLGAILSTAICVDFCFCSLLTEVIGLQNAPEIFNSSNTYYRSITRVWPRLSVKQRDLFNNVIIISMIWFCWHFFYDKMKHMKFIFIVEKNANGYLISQDGKYFPEKLQMNFQKYWSKMSPRMKLVSIFMIFDINLLFFFPYCLGEWFLPDADTGSFRRILYFIITPYNFTVISYHYIISFHFLLVCGCIRIKQHYLRDKIDTFAKNLYNQRYKTERKFHITKSWLHHMKTCIHLVREISFFNAFWRPYMSSSFVVYTLKLSFAFYFCLSTFSYQLVPLVFFEESIFFYLLKASLDSASVESRNVHLYRALRKAHFTVQNRGKTSLNFFIKTGSFLEFDNFFRRSSFKLVNGCRINTRLLEIFFTSLIGISLKVYGDTIRRQLFL